ncbi:MAG: SDR family NAD(P)-dependent oxidoreductase [Chitinophagaceae bacterium]|nr:SDR family NAD(P)-dependent oxidoreductase [Chitinophagaceae bacterium]
MKQKKIIIIGASSGIGKEMAKIYAQHNLVAISGRRNDLLLQLQNQYPEAIIPFCFDVTGIGNIAHLQSMIKRLGGLDLLIYNAGFGDPSKELNCESEIITTKTNVNGFVEIVSWTFNYFVQQGHGQIAITSSVAALRGNSWAPAYSASKAFMSNYAEGLNIKAKRMVKDIVITDIKPGFVDTKLAKGNTRFWTSSPQKAARQIVRAIVKRKRSAYITRRWWLVAQLLKILPYSLYRRFA